MKPWMPIALLLLLTGLPGPARLAGPQAVTPATEIQPGAPATAVSWRSDAVAAGALSLADRVAQAQPGDTILVDGGIWREPTLRIDRAIHLVGRNWPVLDGEGSRGLVEILADSVSLSGFVFRNTGVTFMDDRSAVRATAVSGCELRGNRFEETFFGLYLAETSGCLVDGNLFRTTPDREANGGNAIHSWHSERLTISSNTISGHRDGIYLEFTTDSAVRGNVSTDNLRYGLHFMFSDRCSYRENTFSRNGAGVAVMYADHVVMADNIFEAAWGASAYGLLLKEIKGGTVSGNAFLSNSVALFVESTDRVEFSGNRFERNGWGIRVMADATDNQFIANTFLRNTFDVATNSRTTSRSTFASNYWDRYDGYDLDADGKGDVPFHPVRFYAFLVEQHEPALVLLRSALVDVLDAVEAVVPLFTPQSLVDETPLMKLPPARGSTF